MQIENGNIVAIVVTYNRKELLRECILSLINQTVSNNISIIIIDNNSSDGTREMIAEMMNDDRIAYCNTGKNLGGAGGFEYGVCKAMEREFDYLWIMDDDCIPENDAAEQFLSAAKKLGNFGFMSSYVKWIDGTVCTMNVQRKNIARKLNKFDKEMIPIQIATFVSMFIPYYVVKETGAPIGEFFIWGDDWDYSRRISKKYPSYLIMRSVVTHKTLHNYGCDVSNDVPERINRYWYFFRNRVYQAKTEGMLGFVYWILNLAKNILKVLIFSQEKKERLKIIFKGTIDGIKFNPKEKKFD